ncbi:MAG TPA: hypothetical protein VLH84_04365 [Patescibacteria group bacterium]|nr:hypothetical protein [Patescibacteria group bacterium]
MRSFDASSGLTTVHLDARDPSLSIARVDTPMIAPAEFEELTGGVKNLAPWLRIDIPVSISVPGQPAQLRPARDVQSERPRPVRNARRLWVFGHTPGESRGPSAFTAVPEIAVPQFLDRVVEDPSGAPRRLFAYDLGARALSAAGERLVIGRGPGYAYADLLRDTWSASRMHAMLGVEESRRYPGIPGLRLDDLSRYGTAITARDPIIGPIG